MSRLPSLPAKLPWTFLLSPRYVCCTVQKLPEVEEAKGLMKEAMDWSVFTWLFQKRTVRQTADRANAALDELNQSVKAGWGSDLKSVYKELTAKTGGRRGNPEAASESINPETKAFVQKVKEADDAAHLARMTAEETFDEAERQLNTDLAREGCRQAIRSWELHEKAIRRAEAVPGVRKATS
jgi:hypothetical protein